MEVLNVSYFSFSLAVKFRKSNLIISLKWLAQQRFDGSLIMSFLTLHYTSHLLCHVDIQRHLYKTRLNPVLAVPPSSILLHTNESEKFPESKKGSGSSTPYRSVDFAGSVVSQVNTVGIIGGVSCGFYTEFFEKTSQVELKGWRKLCSFCALL